MRVQVAAQVEPPRRAAGQRACARHARARPCPRGARAGSARSRDGGRPRPRRRCWKTSPVSTSSMPHSETFRPRLTASSRMRDVVGLRAGEVLQEVAEDRGRDDAQVDLDAVVRDDRALRIAAADDLRRDGLLAEPGRSAPPRSSEAAIRSMSPTISTRRRSDPASDARTQAGVRPQRSRSVSRQLERALEQDDATCAGAAAGGDRLEDRLLLLLGDAGVPAQRARGRCRLELLERRDAELVVDALGGLRADARAGA